MSKGLFVVVDGPSGSGKDTVIKRVLEDLKKLNLKSIAIEETKEKGYDRKKILLAKEQGGKKVAQAIIEERKKLYLTKIMPQLKDGIFVIANRGEPTTLAYQTIKNELTMDDVWNMHRKQNILLPDLVVITNCNVEEAIRREKLRTKSEEEKDKNFMSGKFTSDREKIHQNYERIKDFLMSKGISVIYLNTQELSIQEESQMIVNYIKNKINYIHVN